MADYEITVSQGRRLLRFTSLILNVGPGPLEVIGRRRGGTMEARQVLYSARRLLRREFSLGAFEYHAEHGHWHLLQVGEYRLRDAAGEVVSRSDKVSFCLRDSEQPLPDLPASPRVPRYGDCSRDPQARGLLAGISVGWADLYSRFLDEQWVDVTGLPAGEYTLEVEVDPDRLLREATRDNNIAALQVTLPPS